MLKSTSATRLDASAERSGPRSPKAAGLTGRIYAIMGLTTAATFATLETIHQLFFTHSVFA